LHGAARRTIRDIDVGTGNQGECERKKRTKGTEVFETKVLEIDASLRGKRVRPPTDLPHLTIPNSLKCKKRSYKTSPLSFGFFEGKLKKIWTLSMS
jgi:hypothetical protein